LTTTTKMNNRIWMLLPPSMLFLLSMFYRYSSAVIASELMHDLSLTAANLGLLSSVFFYAFALIQIPMGAAMDLFGPRRLILFLSSMGIMGAMIFALADSFAVAVIGRILLGFGMASALMGTYKLIAIWFPPYAFATLSGIVGSVGAMGSVGATAPLALAVEWMGWRKAFMTIALIHLIITAWIYFVVRDRPEEEEKIDTVSSIQKNYLNEALKGTRQVIQLPAFWLIAIAAFVRSGIFHSVSGLWAGPYLEYVYHISLVDRGKMLMAFPIGYIVGGPFLGFLSDRILKNRKWVVFMALSFYAFFIFPLAGSLPHFYFILIVVIFFGIGFFSSCMPVIYANIKELLPSSLSGTALTAVNFFTMSGAAFFQHIMGAMIDSLSPLQGQMSTEAFSFAFGFCFVAAAIGAVVYVFVKEKRH